jgi:membrane fusion protein (multidrug efflux system)
MLNINSILMMNHLKVNRMMRIMVFAVSVPLIFSCGNKRGGLPEDDEYGVRTLQTSSSSLNNSYPAVIRGKQDIEIRPKISGFITRLCVDEGSVVHRGQVLFEIDDVQYREAVKQGMAAVNVAKAQIATSRLTYMNKKQLRSQNIIGDYDLQTAANNYASARANLSQAEASLIAARQNLSYCHVTSPSNGVVGTIPFRVGSLVSSASTQPLTTVSDIDEMYVYFSMTEKQLLSMTRKAGNANAALKMFPAVQLKLSDGSLYSQLGKVSTISGVIDQTTGTVSVRANFKNPKHLLKSGGSGSIIVPYVANDIILIPQTAVSELQDKKYVYIVGNNNKVKYAPITVADVDDGQNYIVTSGLQAGQRIVTQGIASLQDGMVIKPISEAAAAAKIKKAEEMGAAQGNMSAMKKMMSGK